MSTKRRPYEDMTALQQVVVAVADEGGVTINTAARQVALLFRLITEKTLSDGRFAYPGFGVWTRTVRKARQLVNPATKKLMEIPATKTIRWRAAKKVKQVAAKKRF